jgi:diguanylate cyclase (GGDEF)-like protein/PAS domain S-box-containing protein
VGDDGDSGAAPVDPDGDGHGVGAANGDEEDEAKGAGEEGAGDADATATVPGHAEGDGSALTRMPQPASSIAAPAAASTPAHRLDLTSASSSTPPCLSPRRAAYPRRRSGVHCRARGVEETGDDARQHSTGPDAPRTFRRRERRLGFVTPHVEGHPRHDLETCLAEIDHALTELLEARAVLYVGETTCSPVALPLVHTVNRMIRLLEEIVVFVVPLARGELSAPLPSPDNAMAAPLVEMHDRLSRLTRQTQEIARGDYSQRIDFMGEFSEAFNAMVVLLEERERSLTDEIARRKQAESDLQRERDLLVAGPVVTFRWDVDDEGVVQYVSPNISAYGYTAEEFVSGRRTYASIVDPADCGWITEDGNDKSRTGLEGWTQEYRIADADGETHWIRDFTHTVRGKDGEVTAYEGYIIDITPQKEAENALRRREEQLRMLSLSDELTGLYNRRGFFALGEHAMRIARRRSKGLGVISLDVDGLKAINDRFGHTQGDEVLCAVADIIRASVRESDVIGRVGGDEFVILADDGPEITAELVTRLQRSAERLNGKKSRPFRLTLSIGAVDWEVGEQVTLQELIERADQRVYDVKRARRRT